MIGGWNRFDLACNQTVGTGKPNCPTSGDAYLWFCRFKSQADSLEIWSSLARRLADRDDGLCG